MRFKEIFKNCLSVYVDNDVYYPVRFTEKQLDFYKNYSKETMPRSHCSAGVTMEFITTRDEISFSCKTDHFVRKFCTFDIYENNSFAESYTFSDCPETVSVRYKKSANGPALITIYLPFSCRTGIYDMDFGDFMLPDPKEKNLLCLGDSISQGMTTEYSSLAYTTLLASHFNMNLLNQSIGTFRFCADSLDAALPYSPDIITVAYGTNDLNQVASFDEIVGNADAYIGSLKDIFKSSKIFIISPIWRQTAIDNPEKLKRFLALGPALDLLCDKYDVSYINGLGLVPNKGDFFVDGLHPNSKGFLIYTHNLIKNLQDKML